MVKLVDMLLWGGSAGNGVGVRISFCAPTKKRAFSDRGEALFLLVQTVWMSRDKYTYNLDFQLNIITVSNRTDPCFCNVLIIIKGNTGNSFSSPNILLRCFNLCNAKNGCVGWMKELRFQQINQSLCGTLDDWPSKCTQHFISHTTVKITRSQIKCYWNAALTDWMSGGHQNNVWI